MFKLIIFGTLFYFIWKLIRFSKFLANQGVSKKSKEKDPYKKFDIKDADFEDIDEKKND
ncbi:MAG: hypothetical protein V3S48_01250 [Candidatus Neomarinimicrobiota bacterium]